jgi:hypothetical protein
MQTLKRWLNKMFAWWPWKRLANEDGPQPTHRVSWNVPSEGSWRSTTYGMDQSIPQPGSISIIIEQQMDNTYSNLFADTTRISQTQQPLTNSSAQSSPTISSASETDKQLRRIAYPKQDATSDMERHLQFLRYLVQRGTFNDDLG